MVGNAYIASLPKDVQTGIRLEGIFMPETRRQREKFLLGTEGPKFVHYTKAESALQIIETKRIWLRNTTAMSDYREIYNGFDLINGFFKDPTNMQTFKDALEPCGVGAAQEAIDQFNGWWSNTAHGIQTRTYIASISEHSAQEEPDGRLSMWRAFGTEAPSRVAFVLKTPLYSGAMDHLKCLFSPVSYLTGPQVINTVQEVIENIKREAEFLKELPRPELVRSVFAMLVMGVICLKHQGFREEREWRIIYLPGLNESPLIESEIRTIGGVPQLIYKLPIDKNVAEEISDIELSTVFDRLLIGPTTKPWVMYDAFTRALKKAGVADADSRVFTSGITLRSL